MKKLVLLVIVIFGLLFSQVVLADMGRVSVLDFSLTVQMQTVFK